MHDRESHSEVEIEKRAALLKEHLRKRGIELALIDFDDTLIYIQEIFLAQMAVFYEQIAHEHNLEIEVVASTLHRINRKGFETTGISVSIDGWYKRIEQFEQEMGIQVSPEHTDILMHIYQTPPRIREGATQTLDVFQKGGIQTGLVTHANNEWTFRKLEQTGLKRYFADRDIHVIDEKGFKTPDAWKEAIETYQKRPIETIVVGNSLSSDIYPAVEIGVKEAYWLNVDDGSANIAENLPENVVEIAGIHALLDELIK